MSKIFFKYFFKISSSLSLQSFYNVLWFSKRFFRPSRISSNGLWSSKRLPAFKCLRKSFGLETPSSLQKNFFKCSLVLKSSGKLQENSLPIVLRDVHVKWFVLETRCFRCPMCPLYIGFRVYEFLD